MAGYMCNRFLIATDGDQVDLLTEGETEKEDLKIYKELIPNFEIKSVYGPFANTELGNPYNMRDLVKDLNITGLQPHTVRKLCLSTQRAVMLANIISIDKFQKIRLNVDVFRDLSKRIWKLAVII